MIYNELVKKRYKLFLSGFNATKLDKQHNRNRSKENMKTLLKVIIGLIIINLVALIINVLYSNVLLSAITTLALFGTLLWMFKKAMEL